MEGTLGLSRAWNWAQAAAFTLSSSTIGLAAGAPPRALVMDGRPVATIVLRPDASQRETQAAQEIQHYIERSSGAVLPIQSATERPSGNRIIIEVRRIASGSNPETFTITTRGRNVQVIGNSPLAALYGAYELLERGLGVRWYVPGDLGEVVPRRRTILLPQLNFTRSPSFAMRWIGAGEWALRNRQNPCDDGFVISPGIYHTQSTLLPHQQYFKERPEFFALVKGRRSEDPECKLCTSNPAVAAEVARNMARMLDQNPEIALLSLSPTDGMLYCECDQCRAQDEPGVSEDQTMSRRMLLFYNAVAGRLKQTHPKAKMLVGAYHIYTRPPGDPALKADPIINVIICHYESYCMAHPISDPNCPPNARYRELVKGWQDLGCKVCFYEYYWKVNWMDLPWPIVHSIKEDMRWYKQTGIQGVYTQYNPDNAWTLGPGYYVAARLLWDVSADAGAILSGMCEDLFGKAAPAMKAYYTIMEQRMANCGAHFPGHGLEFGPLIFTDEVRAAMHREYERAQSLNDDPMVAQRLEKIGCSLEYVDRMMQYAKLAAEIKTQSTPAKAAAKAVEARDLISRLHDEILNDRNKWGGVVSLTQVTGEPYLTWEKEAAAKLAESLTAKAASTGHDVPGPKQ